MESVSALTLAKAVKQLTKKQTKASNMRTIIEIFFSESGMELFYFVELKIIQIIDPIVNKQ
jgi:hypothetical protein